MYLNLQRMWQFKATESTMESLFAKNLQFSFHSINSWLTMNETLWRMNLQEELSNQGELTVKSI